MVNDQSILYTKSKKEQVYRKIFSFLERDVLSSMLLCVDFFFDAVCEIEMKKVRGVVSLLACARKRATTRDQTDRRKRL